MATFTFTTLPRRLHYCVCQASYHSDEVLRNLRRRAPLIAIRDDHETENNLFGQGSNSKTGAENHQPVCAVSPSSFGYVKRAAKCDRDDGYVTQPFTAAAPAYMEWIPVRRGRETIGVVTTKSLNRVLEWGKLASRSGQRSDSCKFCQTF